MMRRGLGLRLGDIATGAAAKSSLVTDLVSYWALGEASGTRADSVGSADLTDNNTVGADTGKNGNAASFVHDNAEYLTCSEIAVGQSDEGMTFAGWFNLNYSGAYPVFVSGDPGASGKLSFGLYFNGTNAYGRFTDSDATQLETAGIEITLDAWHHAVGWFDPADKKARISIDGASAVATAAFGTTSLSSYTTFGIGWWTYYTGWTGLIDEVGLWNRVLTEDERAELYNGGDGKFYNATTGDFA